MKSLCQKFTVFLLVLPTLTSKQNHTSAWLLPYEDWKSLCSSFFSIKNKYACEQTHVICFQTEVMKVYFKLFCNHIFIYQLDSVSSHYCLSWKHLKRSRFWWGNHFNSVLNVSSSLESVSSLFLPCNFPFR